MGIVNIPGLKDSKGELFPVIPAGKYPVKIMKLEEAKTKEDGKYPNADMLKVGMQILESAPEHGGTFLMTQIMLPDDRMPAMCSR